MHPIQLFVPTFRIEECLAGIRECLEKGWTGLGFKTVEFERVWKDYSGLPHAHFLNSATAGLHLAVALLKEAGGWQPGDEVVTTPLTFVSTNHAILYEGLKPVFADVEESLCLDPRSVRERISGRTRAVMYVGLGGNVGRYEEIVALCRDRGLQMILDASHMAGTRLHGRHVGPEAEVSVFSFQAVKNLPTADSGLVCFTDGALDAEARKWSWLGINKDTYSRTVGEGAYKWHYDVEHVGFKYNGNSLMAAIALVSLKYLDEDNAHRRRLAARYEAALAGAAGVERVPMAPDCVPSRHLYQVLVEKRDETMVALNERQIFPGVHYRDNTLYSMYAYARGTCPRSMSASDRVIPCPPLRMSEEDAERIASTLREVVGAGGGMTSGRSRRSDGRVRLRPSRSRTSAHPRLAQPGPHPEVVPEPGAHRGRSAPGPVPGLGARRRLRPSSRTWGDGRPVGQIALTHRLAGRPGRVRRLMIGEGAAAGRGLAKAATRLLVDQALDRLGLAEVYLEVRADNAPAIAIYRACGFEVTSEGGDVVHMKRTVPP